MGTKVGRYLLLVGPSVFLAIFFVWPVTQLFVRSFSADRSSVGDAFSSSTLQSALWFTLWQAVLSTVLTMLASLPLTAVMANVSFRGRRLVRTVVTIPFVLPTVVVAGAFIATNDRLGLDDTPFALENSVLAIIVAHVFFNVAVVVRTVGGYWSQLSRDDEQAARVLGNGPVQAFLGITVRRLQPALLAAASIVFLFTFTSFGVVLILGGSRHRTIETEIFRYAVTRTDFATAATLSVIQLLAVIVLVMVNLRLQERLPTRDRLITDRARPARSISGRVISKAVIITSLALLMIPVVVLIDQSFASGGSWSLANYKALTQRPRFLSVTPFRAIVNSLGFAVVAAMIATIIGGWASLVIAFGRRGLSRATDLGYLLPLGTSAVTLGFGILVTFDTGLLDLRRSWIIVPLAQALVAIPFVTRAVTPVLRAIDPHLREAAASMGASPKRIRRDIDLPIARRAFTVGAGFAFAISLGEFGATSFVGRNPDLMTVPLAIERLLGQPGQIIRGQAMALSVILMMVTAVVLLIVDRADRGGVL